MKDLAGPVAFSVSCYIDGYKFHDLNADGIWQLGADGEPNTGDAGEEPTLSGWTIELDGTNGVTDTTTTDENGYFRFDSLSDATYTVSEVCPSDWIQSYPAPNPAASCGDNTHSFDINLTTPNGSGNFGNYQHATFSGMKFKDADNSGTNNEGDSGLSGWTIKVFADDGDGVLDGADTFITSTVTASDGGYTFTLAPGDYIFCEVSQTDWQQTAPTDTVCDADGVDATLADDGFAATLTSGQLSENQDFGNTPLSKFDVLFYDKTGSTNATISCSTDDSLETSGTDEAADPETTLSADGVVIGTYNCTITITDP
jgi:serine-aspartate repeat-containing protein C/D/E